VVRTAIGAAAETAKLTITKIFDKFYESFNARILEVEGTAAKLAKVQKKMSDLEEYIHRVARIFASFV